MVSLGTNFLDHALCLFTRRELKDLEQETTNRCAVSAGEICVHCDTLRGVSDNRQLAGRLYVVLVGGEHNDRSYCFVRDDHKLEHFSLNGDDETWN